MIFALIDIALRNRLFVVMSALLLLAAGVVAALHLPVDAVPGALEQWRSVLLELAK